MFRFYIVIDYVTKRDTVLLDQLLRLAYRYCNLMIVYDVPDMNMFVCECATVLKLSDTITKLMHAVSKPLARISTAEYLQIIQVNEYQPLRGYYQFGDTIKTWTRLGTDNYDELIYYSSLIDKVAIDNVSDDELNSSGSDIEMDILRVH